MAIDLFRLFNHAFQREPLADDAKSLSTQALAFFSITEQAKNGFGQRARVADGDESSCFAVFDDLTRACGARCYDGHAARHRFDDRKTEPFGTRSGNEKIKLHEQTGRVINPPHEMDSLAEAESANEPFKLRAHIFCRRLIFTSDDEVNVVAFGGDQRGSADKIFVPLDRREVADGADQQAVLDAQTRDRFELLQVDAVRHAHDLRWIEDRA
ncbi:MAG: hypothetical protein C4334_12055 [Pyrinomonas sp.]